jgi:hypothetical protein
LTRPTIMVYRAAQSRRVGASGYVVRSHSARIVSMVSFARKVDSLIPR